MYLTLFLKTQKNIIEWYVAVAKIFLYLSLSVAFVQSGRAQCLARLSPGGKGLAIPTPCEKNGRSYEFQLLPCIQNVLKERDCHSLIP